MVYLNNAATSWPKPPQVIDAVQACLRDTPASQFRGGSSILKKDVMMECRKALGQLLEIAEVNRIFFTSGATESLNTVLAGWDYGEENRSILITQTEHNSVLRPLMNLDVLKRRVVKVVPCTANGEITEAALQKAVEEEGKEGRRPAALVVNHCSNVTGFVQNMRMISEFARNEEISLIVDASQSAGCLTVQTDSWQADALIFTGHKGLMGMQGTGGYYIRGNKSLKPLKYGGTGRNSAQLKYHGDYEYEVGTQNLPGITALLAGTEFVLNTGMENIRKKEQGLMTLLYRRLGEIQGIRLYGDPLTCKGPLLSMNFIGLTASDAAYILDSVYGITVRTGLHCSPLIHQAMGTGKNGTVRLSISYFTENEDILQFIHAAEQIAASCEQRQGE